MTARRDDPRALMMANRLLSVAAQAQAAVSAAIKAIRKARDSGSESVLDESSADHACVYFCACCGEMAIVSDTAVDAEHLHARPEDGSLMLDAARRRFNHFCVREQKRLVRRETGVETQFLYRCRGCDVPLLYRTAPQGEPGVACVLPGAVTVHKHTVRARLELAKLRRLKQKLDAGELDGE
jgi:hypothetical protein